MLTTGVDIVQINRIEKIIRNRKDSFYNRIFTKNEITYIEKRNNSPATVAGLFATKEAVSKAVGSGIGKIAWKDIEIVHDKNRKPIINISSKLQELLCSQGLNSIEVSISHEKEYAISFAVCYLNRPLGD